jgi:chitodextrinase
LAASDEGQIGYEVGINWQNNDTEPVTLVFGEEFGTLTFGPGEAKSKSFSNVGHTRRVIKYYLQNNPSLSSNITLLDPLVVTDTSESTVTLSWGANEGTSGYPTIGYQVYRNNIRISQTSATSFKDTNLNPNTSYTYRMVSYNKDGLSDATNTVAVMTKETPPIAKPEPEKPTTTQPATQAKPTTTITTDNKIDVATVTVTDTNKNTILANASLTTDGIITISGTAKPKTKIIITLHSDPVQFETTSDAAGLWTRDIPLSGLTTGSHLITAKPENGTDVTLASFTIVDPVATPVVAESNKGFNPAFYISLGITLIIAAILGALWYKHWKTKRIGRTETTQKVDSNF